MASVSELNGLLSVAIIAINFYRLKTDLMKIKKKYIDSKKKNSKK